MRIKAIFTLALLAIVLFSCQKEIISPDAAGQPNISFSGEGLYPPASPCGGSVFSTLVDGGTVCGTVEIAADASNLYILTDMTAPWLLQNVKLFVGNRNDIAVTSDGAMQVESFPYMFVLAPHADQYTLTVPLAGLPTCFDIVIRAGANSVNMFGQTTGHSDLWADGTSFADGFSIQFCRGACSLVANNNAPLN